MAALFYNPTSSVPEFWLLAASPTLDIVCCFILAILVVQASVILFFFFLSQTFIFKILFLAWVYSLLLLFNFFQMIIVLFYGTILW